MMWKDLSTFRPVAIIVLVSFMIAVIGTPAIADENIKLKRSLFGGVKFSQEGSQPAGIYGFSAFSHTSEFKDAMSSCPIALKETRKAFAYNGVALAGMLGILVYSIKGFVKTLRDVRDVSSGIMVDNSFKIGDVIMVGTGAMVTITASRLGHRYLKKGVRMFNEGCTVAPSPLSPREHGNEFGARLGFNSASMSGGGGGSKTGLHFCYYQPIPLGEMVTLQPEYALTQKGASHQIPEVIDPYSGMVYPASEGSVSHWYLEIPFLLKISPIDSKLRPSFFVGPAPALRLGSTVTRDGEEIDSGTEYNVLDIGIVFGASVLIPNSQYSIDARYISGLSKVHDTTDSKNRVFSLTFGAHF